jgi:hypothetical protein
MHRARLQTRTITAPKRCAVKCRNYHEMPYILPDYSQGGRSTALFCNSQPNLLALPV